MHGSGDRRRSRSSLLPLRSFSSSTAPSPTVAPHLPIQYRFIGVAIMAKGRKNTARKTAGGVATSCPLGASRLVQVRPQSPPPEPPPPVQPSDAISERQVAIGGRASSRVVDSVRVCPPSPSPPDSSPLNSGVHSAAMVEHSSLNATSMWPFLFPRYTWSAGCNVLRSFLLPPICSPRPPMRLYHSIS